MYKLALLISSLCPLLCFGESYSSLENHSRSLAPKNLQAVSAKENAQRNLDVFTDLLYWHVGEVGTIPNSTISTKLDPDFVSKLNLNNLSFGWNFGYRVGGRYSNLGNDEWGISLFYTGYRSKAKNSGSFDGFVGIPTGFPLTQTITDASFLQLFWLFAAQSFRAEWALDYKVLDFELDRKYLVSKTVTLRPYLGVRTGWIQQNIHIHSTYHDVTNNNLPVQASEKLTNHFWGIGPSWGLDTKWCLGRAKGHFFSLFDDFSGAFLWSRWSSSDHLTVGDTITGTLKSKHRRSGSLMFQNLIGVEWRVKLNQRGAQFSLRLGFESQFWFDNLQVFNTYNGRQHNALTLQGGTFDLHVCY